MARFKVGDRVVCIIDQGTPMVKKGDIGVITSTAKQFDYVVDFENREKWPMNEDELEYAKEYQVLTILRNYKNEKETSNL